VPGFQSGIRFIHRDDCLQGMMTCG
jgi:hypothetical protein